MSIKELNRLIQWYIWNGSDVTDRERESAHEHFGCFVSTWLRTLPACHRMN